MSAADRVASVSESVPAAGTSGEADGEGNIIKGLVVQVTRDAVVINIGGKSEGRIPRQEFLDASGAVTVKAGDTVDVFVESRESDEGLISLSKEKADKMKVWDEISSACERDEIIEGTISQRVKGGLSVTVKGGVKAFLPGSQVDLRPVRNLDKLIGQTYEFKVIKFNKKRGNIVLSRRVLLERQRDEMKQRTLETLEEGQVLEGTIKNLTEYGAFVDLGGIEGLLHIMDMSWGRVNHPREMFKVGEKVAVKVLKYNAATERVSLGLKQTQEVPWNHVQEAYPLGKKVSGRVMRITEYGAFVELEPGVDGLIHVSEMSWIKKITPPSKMLKVGHEVECQVLEVDSRAKRISLGLRQFEADPWSLFTDKYKPGDKVEGKVRAITEYGVFVDIEDGVDGMVRQTDLSWSANVKPQEMFQMGDDVEAIILSINHDEKTVSLGIKQVWDDPWPDLFDRFQVGAIVESAEVVRVTDYGVFVRLEPGIDAVIPLSDIPEHVDLQKGTLVRSMVANLDWVNRRITWTRKEAGRTPATAVLHILNNDAEARGFKAPEDVDEATRVAMGQLVSDGIMHARSARRALESIEQDLDDVSRQLQQLRGIRGGSWTN